MTTAPNSTEVGYVEPSAVPAPLEDAELQDFFQEVVVGITGLPGKFVRPAWQQEPPNLPPVNTDWAALAITARPSDTYPYVGHDGTGDGSDNLQRHEDVEVLTSFYGPHADKFMSLWRDGLAIPQNRETLTLGSFVFVACDPALTVPSLVKERWLYRVDLPVHFRRQIDRTYPIRNLVQAIATLRIQNGSTRVIPIQTTIPE